jgi:hypothetical protein
MTEPARFRSTGALAAGAQALLYANAAIAALAAALIFAGWYGKSGPAALLAIAELALYVGCAIVFLIWLYRASSNARALGARDMMVTPGWAVGWYFVPLANLGMPYVTMRDLWKASAKPRDWQIESAPATIALWWGCWIVANLTGLIAFRLEYEMGVEALPATQGLGLVSEIFTIPAALLLTRIIAGIQAMQERAKGTSASAVFT